MSLAETRDWDAVETAERVARRDVSALEVIDAAIARAEEAAHLGAIVTQTFERARAAAPVGRPGVGPLGGVPMFVKDLAQVRGVATGWGSRGAGHYVSRKTDRIVTRFERAGTVSLGKSATPEFGLTATTEPLGFAACKNPWDPTRSPGGSSGGAGSLVASGVVPIAHASDGGGSIRIPAACCGLVGLKPSRFRLDMEGSNLLPINIACDGVVTRTVRDTVAFFDAIESQRAPSRVPPIGDVRRAPARLRVGLYTDSPTGSDVHSETRAAVEGAGRLCESLGHEVEAIACPFDASVIDDFLQYWGFVAWIQARSARVMLHWRFDATRLEPWTDGIGRTFVERPRATWEAVGRLRAFAATYARTFERYDVLISPTSAEPAPTLGYLATDLPFRTVFDRLRAYCPFTPIQNAAGAPAISLPLGKSSTGLPIGVQLAAAHGRDRTLLELARSLEEARPWARAAPRERWARA